MAWDWPKPPSSDAQLERIYYLVQTLYRDVKALRQQQEMNMALSDLQDAVSRQSNVKDRVVALLERLTSDLQAALSAQDSAALQAIIDQVQANTDALAGAVDTAEAATTTPPPAA